MNKPSKVPSPKKRLSPKDRLDATVSEDKEYQQAADKVCEQISKLVGMSPELVIVRRLWFRRFRVNILHPDLKPLGVTSSFFIGQSYFVRTNEQGEIVRSEPPLPERN